MCQTKVDELCKKKGDDYLGCNAFDLPQEEYEIDRREDPFGRTPWHPMKHTGALTGRRGGTRRRKTSKRRRKTSKRKQYKSKSRY